MKSLFTTAKKQASVSNYSNEEPGMTNEEIINAFPECERVHKEDIVDVVSRAFDELESYRQIRNLVYAECEKIWPCPEYEGDGKDYHAWCDHFYSKPFYAWFDDFEAEFRRRKGYKRTFNEACDLAADIWANKIFGWHLQDNGAINEDHAGGFWACALGTVLKNDITKDISEDVVNKFRKLMSDYYKEWCLYVDKKDGWKGYVEPYCDYNPNCALYSILIEAGVKENNADMICPWKTGIVIDEKDYHVVVRTYRNQEYI